MNKKFFILLFTMILFSGVFLQTATAGEKTPKNPSENIAPAANPVVRFHTSQGDIDVQLFPNIAPLTVANFLGYVNRGDYDNSFIHRLAPNFVLQGGGYKFDGMNTSTIPQQQPVMNEFHISNTRSTLAMAKLSGNPNSATNQWFFNLADNSSNLDNQNGGFTVFGRVLNQNSQTVLDAISIIPIYNLGSPFDQIPLVNYMSGPVMNSNLVTVISITTVANKSTQFDFDGDGKADISVFRPSERIWYLNRSSAGFAAAQFGLSTDILAPADYDGDGKTDVAVFRAGNWYLLRSTLGFASVAFGQAGDIPVPADFDGDGKAELAVYRSGNWYSLNLVSNQFSAVSFGTSTDKPVAGDFDGDGKADQAVFRPTEGYWYLNTLTQGVRAVQFGVSTDRIVPADYDGDGKTDVAVFRDGNWYRLNSSNNQFVAVNFGLASDLPVPADYDGDGKTDTAVFRNGNWYILQSTNGFTAQAFGQTGDKPVPNVFVR